MGGKNGPSVQDGFLSGMVRLFAILMIMLQLYVLFAVLMLNPHGISGPLAPDAYSITEDATMFTAVILQVISVVLLSTTWDCFRTNDDHAGVALGKKTDGDDETKGLVISTDKEVTKSKLRGVHLPGLILACLSCLFYTICAVLTFLALAINCTTMPACAHNESKTPWVLLYLITVAITWGLIVFLSVMEFLPICMPGPGGRPHRRSMYSKQFQAVTVASGVACITTVALLFFYTSRLVAFGLDVTAYWKTYMIFLIPVLIQLTMFFFLGAVSLIHWLTGGYLMLAWIIYFVGWVTLIFSVGFSGVDLECLPPRHVVAWCDQADYRVYHVLLWISLLVDAFFGLAIMGMLYSSSDSEAEQEQEQE
jgi:hypothetical protein